MAYAWSTSRQMYQRITYRISRMAKRKSATKMALVTGETRGCMVTGERAAPSVERIDCPSSSPGTEAGSRLSLGIITRTQLGRELDRQRINQKVPFFTESQLSGAHHHPHPPDLLPPNHSLPRAFGEKIH
ncbi:hypothetical protein chiPu_0018198 [Chiloscyllium punctatum]|uniref:Uncharacterized protein n=1 Tax=Chiloscyllium punctatum TaxID=137246 RepID=A0A401RLT1_CHIPU|nr:hypothetical protein [Chiloscyllium punctatum]